MPQARKVFRIEQQMKTHTPLADSGSLPMSVAVAEVSEVPGFRAIMQELQSLKALIKPAAEISNDTIEAFHSELAAAGQIRDEMESIQSAIAQTKQEIATLHQNGFKGERMERVTNELDAIVMGTEDATDQILGAAEVLDSHASHLFVILKDKQDKDIVTEMQEQVIRIFEACNFQDLTGQRITKIVSTLKFIEERIMNMVAIWGGLENLGTALPDEKPKATGHAALLHGPALSGEEGRVNQADIDALFN